MTARLSSMEEERNFLLSSLDDLEVEYAAGDLDEADYQALKGDYTVRAADLIRDIEGVKQKSASRRSESKTTTKGSKSQGSKSQGSSKTGRSFGRLVATAVGLLGFAVGAGWLLAQAVGERGASGSLTGTIDESARDKVLTCQQLMSAGELRDSLVCFDEVLTEDPQNVEALTYKGWFLILASGSAQQAGDDEAFAQFVALGEESLTKAVEVDPGFADARAFRVVVFSRTGREEEACAELAVLDSLRPSPMIIQLIQPMADSLACK